MNYQYLSIEEVVSIHDDQIVLFGGGEGIRDEGALVSAIMRPQIGYYEGLVQEAAAMMESLAMNHPFLDGNKRVAFFATDAFLRLNGHFIDCDNEEAYAYFMNLFETGAFRFSQLNGWLEEHVRQL